MPAQWQRPAWQRLASFGLVVALHALVIALLVSQSATVEELVPAVLRVVQIARPPLPPPPPPSLPPKLVPPDLVPLPVPDVTIAQAPSPRAPRAVTRVAPAASHFGPATDDAGLGVAVATRAGGGARGRGSLGAFEAAVKRAVLARKSQPTLAWDRRNTCIINYTVTVAPDGA
ncbi:MAG TPA: hypothetical protein VMB71_05255, partial [Acetobacteraceae bacterium]|nr:hypothetical protein [Acetobacteraceae bacterium]